MVRIFLCRIPIDLSMDAVEADTTGETEAGTTQRDVVRQGVVTISVSFSVSAAWLKRLSAYSKQDKLTVRYFDTKLLYCIIKAIPKDKRLALADNINDAKDNWMYDDKEDSYKEKVVFCKHFLEKNAKYFWRMLHLQIGESCKASAGSYSASYIAIADHI